MISDTWAEQTLAATFTTPNAIPFAAQRTGDKKTLVLRAVNPNGVPQGLTVDLQSVSLSGTQFTVWVLSGASPAEDNTPAFPTRVSPQKISVGITRPDQFRFSLPPYSFVVATAPLS